MKIWVISDTHFGHDKMHLEHGRPQNHEIQILNNLMKIPSIDDILIHLGDVSFYNHAYWHKELRNAWDGQIWLTLGNHDHNTLTFYMKQGWNFVGQQIYLDLFGRDIEFSHRPLDNPIDINVHGHLHSGEHRAFESTDKHFLVNIEKTLAPIQLRSLLKL